jgi:bifunctional non-homologous end joining protein LigD
MTTKQTRHSRAGEAFTQPGLFCLKPDILIFPQDAEASGEMGAEKTAACNQAACLQPFVVKYHRTKKPHFDVRLGYNGAMKSWAMDKRPSLCPDHLRMATEVEDHLREHILFEGVFAEGRRGAGATLVLDCGGWEPLDGYFNIAADLRKGRLRFRLLGERLQGAWAFLRSEASGTGGAGSRWRLIKEPDAFAIGAEEADCIARQEPVSILTGRTVQEVERDWKEGRSKRGPQSAMLFETGFALQLEENVG